MAFIELKLDLLCIGIDASRYLELRNPAMTPLIPDVVTKDGVDDV